MKQLEMCRAARFWGKLFLFSTSVVALLSFWSVISRDVTRYDVLVVKEALFGNGETKSDGQEHGENAAHLRIEQEKKTPVVNFNKNFTRDKADGKLRDRDIRTYINADTGNWIGDMGKLPNSTKPTLNRDKKGNLLLKNKTLFSLLNAGNVKPAEISIASLRRNLSSGKSNSSKQSLDIYTPAAKKSVYGEPGCPDNPWREDLSDLIRTWDKIAKENNIEYVLACGSLLGAMRNGDVIPYDSDIDILMDINYFASMKRLSVERNFHTSDGKIRLVIQPEFPLNIPVDVRKRFDCQGKETSDMVDGCSFQEPMARLLKGDLHIDFFHFYERVHTVDDPCEDRLKEYSKKDFYPFRSCSFMGFDVSCPNNPWEILRIYFKTDNFEPIYKCKNGTWVDEEGVRVDVF